MSAAALNALDYLESLPLHPYEPADPLRFHLSASGQGGQLHFVHGAPPVRNMAANRPLLEDEGPTGNVPRNVVAASPDGE